MIDFKNIPTILKMEGSWCKWELVDGKYKPINPKTNSPAKMNDSRTFGTFQNVIDAIGVDITLDNIGFGLGIFNPICAIDINDCVIDGKIIDNVNEFIIDCNTYAEYSTSGKGIRVIFQANNFTLDKEKYNVKNKQLKAEFICEGSNNKFLAITGNTINNLDVAEINLDYILNKYFSKKPSVEVIDNEFQPPIKFNTNELNDTYYARKFADKFGINLRYNFDNKCWMIWNGKYWNYDIANSVKVMVEMVAEDLRSNIAHVTDANDIKAINNAVNYLLSKRGKENLLSEAQHILPITENELDKDDYLINTASGVLDLRNGKVLDWQRDFYMTKFIDIKLVDKSPQRYWEFLDEIYQGNQELMQYVNRLFAYCLTGDISEQEIYFFVGDGANGKSVLFELMNKIFGSYSRTVSADLLIDKAIQNNCKSELALLKGVRLVFASELDTNQKLKMSIVKNMTGGNEIVACYKYKNEFTYVPKYKVLLATNHMPRISEDDNGSWRRIKKIDHHRIFKKQEQDKHLIDKLYKERGEILNLLFKICPSVLANGLNAPDCVDNSVATFRSSEDILSRWLDESCEPSTSGEFSGDLFENFRQYCFDNNEMYWYKNATTTWFGRRMSKLYNKVDVNRKKYYVGVKMK